MKNYKIPNYILASKNIRFVNFIIDLVFIKIIAKLLFILIDLIFSTGLTNKIDSFDKIETYLFWSITSFFYYSITEFLFSKSIAKFFSRTCVIMQNGEKPQFLNILARSALRQIPFEYFTFLQGRMLGLHDDYSNTFVVRTDKFKQSLKEFNQFN